MRWCWSLKRRCDTLLLLSAARATVATVRLASGAAVQPFTWSPLGAPVGPAAPFAINQIVHKSNSRLESDLAAAVKWRVPVTISSLGARADVIRVARVSNSAALRGTWVQGNRVG